MNAYQDSQTSNIEEQFTRRITGTEGEELEGKHIWIGPTLLHVTEHGRFQCRVEGQQSYARHNLLPNAAQIISHQISPTTVATNSGHSMSANPEKQMQELAEQNSALNDLQRSFVLPTDSSVSRFLSEHRTISQILLESVAHLKVCFSVDSLFDLRAPIDESGSQTLYAVIKWPGTLEDVRRALDRFDDTWWLAHSRQASGYLCFTYELV